jgi:hypothetical protein
VARRRPGEDRRPAARRRPAGTATGRNWRRAARPHNRRTSGRAGTSGAGSGGTPRRPARHPAAASGGANSGLRRRPSGASGANRAAVNGRSRWAERPRWAVGAVSGGGGAAGQGRWRCGRQGPGGASGSGGSAGGGGWMSGQRSGAERGLRKAPIRERTAKRRSRRTITADATSSTFPDELRHEHSPIRLFNTAQQDRQHVRTAVRDQELLTSSSPLAKAGKRGLPSSSTPQSDGDTFWQQKGDQRPLSTTIWGGAPPFVKHESLHSTSARVLRHRPSAFGGMITNSLSVKPSEGTLRSRPSVYRAGRTTTST